MEKPNKIFMPNELLSEDWQRHIEGLDTEYIRKDYLEDLLNKAKCNITDSTTSDERKVAALSVINYLMTLL